MAILKTKTTQKPMIKLTLENVCKRRLLAALVGLLGMAGAASGVQIANDFTITNRANNQPLHLADFAGKILVLDFFAYWCGPCKQSSPQLEIYIQQYYASLGGNPHGVPVQVVAIETDNTNPALTASFVSNAGIDFSALDGPGAYSQFGSGGIPQFVIINCVAGSPTNPQYQVLYSQAGYDPAELYSWTTFKSYINPVLPPGLGRTLTWTGSADVNWSTAGNWVSAPPPSAVDTAIFNSAGAAAQPINLGTGAAIGAIVFDTASVGAFTLGAGAINSQTLTLSNAGTITLNSTVTSPQVFNSALILGTDGSARTFAVSNNSSSAGLTLAGNITGSTGTGAKVLTLAGAGNTTVNGVIADGVSGTLGITKSGAGTLRLAAANTYTAATNNFSTGILKAGIASVPNVSGAFGRNSAVTLSNATGCGLDITGYNTQIGSLAGGGSQGGNVTLGAATLTVGGNNANTTFSGGISSNVGVTGVSLYKSGTGSLILQSATVTSNTYRGKTVIDGGTLAPSWQANSNPGSATVDGGALKMLGTAPATFQADNISIRNGGTLYIMGGAYDDIGDVSQNRGIYLETGTQNILTQNGDVHIFGVISGPGGLLHGNTGSGGYRRLYLNAPNTFTGDSRFDGTGSTSAYGGIELVHPLALQNSAFDTSSPGSNLGFGGNASVTLGGLINSGNLVVPSSVTTLTLNPTLAGITKTYSGVLSGGSTMALVKTGVGIQELTGANSYTGNTSVAVGKLLVNNSSGSATGSGTVTVSVGATLSGSGAISGSLNVSGVLAPGTGIESLSCGDLALLSGSTFACEVNSSAAPSVGADLQKVAGNLSMTGTTTLTITDIAAAKSAFPLGTTFSLVNYTGTWNNGLFSYNSAVLADGSQFTVGLNVWQINYTATTGGTNFAAEYASGHFVNIKVVSVITPYAAWAAAAGLNATNNGLEQDAAHDGITNLAKFAFNGAPNSPSAGGLFVTVLTDNNSDGARELTFTCAVRRSTSVNFAVTGNGAQSATIDGVSYTIEASPTLAGPWTSAVSHVSKSDSPPAASGQPSLSGTAWEYHTFSAFNGLPGRGFLRARVTMP